ncbi:MULTISPECIES: hypothetical protein [unclassified Nocardia]|uniref:hypothetical protein n=1 Tax=unclassified Nocardia TaxID=2637762 RepID=UPI0024A9AD3A|nr:MULTISPECIES: hypothetical protein [unclassified Nocardia]
MSDNRTAYRLQAARARLRKLLAGTDDAGRRRADHGGRPAGHAVQRTVNKVRAMLQR